nr:mucin-2-like [Populus alba]
MSSKHNSMRLTFCMLSKEAELKMSVSSANYFLLLPHWTSIFQKTPTAIAPFSSKTAQPPHHFHFFFLPQTSTTHNADLPLISTGPPPSTSIFQKTPTAIAPFSSKTAQPPHHFHFFFLPQTSTTHNADLPLISTGPPPSLTVSLTPLSATPLFSFENQRDLPDSHKSSPLSRFSFNRLAAALLRPTSTRPSPLSAASPPPPDHQRHPPTAAAPPQQHPISPQLKNPATTTAAAEQSQRQRPLLSRFPLHCWPPETEERKEMTDLQRGRFKRPARDRSEENLNRSKKLKSTVLCIFCYCRSPPARERERRGSHYSPSRCPDFLAAREPTRRQ